MADTPPPKWASNTRVKEELETQYLRVKAWVSAQQLWEQVLSDQDRQELGGDLGECYRRLGTAGMWMKLRGVSQGRAVVDLAHALGSLDPGKHRWLLREIGEEPDAQPTPERPRWEASAGELRRGGRVIRLVRVMAQPSNIQIIIEAFEAAEWRSPIANPLRFGQQQLHQAIRSLNDGLNEISFHAQKGALEITWKAV